MNIVLIIDREELIKLLQHTCLFKVIDLNQCGNYFGENHNASKIQHIKYQQLISKTIPCTNKRSGLDNLWVKVTYYINQGIAIVRLVNVIIELPLVVNYFHSKNNSKTTKIFTTLNRECVGPQFYS